MADLMAPSHPLMDATLDLVQEQYRKVLKQGTVLIDRADEGTIPHVLYIIDHTVRDGSQDKHGGQRIISRRMQFVLIDESGKVSQGGHAPYLDYEEPDLEEQGFIEDIVQQAWLQENMEAPALAHAVKNLVPAHYDEVKERRERMITATLKAVHERLTKEINYWSHRYEKLLLETQAGKQPRMQPENARRRAEDLTERLQQRTSLVVGGALIIPQGLLNQKQGRFVPHWAADPEARRRIEKQAMDAVMAAEKALGYEPHDVSMEKHGWDVLSRTGKGEVRFIEVKGRVKGAPTITVTKNEILASLNKPERYILAIVQVDGEDTEGPWYLRKPFDQEPGFGVTSVNYDIQSLLATAEEPS